MEMEKSGGLWAESWADGGFAGIEVKVGGVRLGLNL